MYSNELIQPAWLEENIISQNKAKGSTILDTNIAAGTDHSI